MKDSIVIKGIEVMAAHGFQSGEQTTPQPFLVDLVVEEDTSIAVLTDDLVNTFLYADLVEDVVTEMSSGPVRFRDTLAARIAERIIERGAFGVEVSIHAVDFPASVPVEDAIITVRRRSPLFDDELGIRRSILRLTSDAPDAPEVIAKAIEDIKKLDVFVSDASECFIGPKVLPSGPGKDRATAVAVVHTAMSPAQLAKELQHVEVRNGRVASSRLSGRRIEIAIMAFGSIESRHPRFTLPHPTAKMDRAFLEAWLSIDPDAHLTGTSVQEIFDMLPRRR